jgi:hypothetical protein
MYLYIKLCYNVTMNIVSQAKEVRQATLDIVCAPSRATPQLGLPYSRDDFKQAERLAGNNGLVGFTEIMRTPWRHALNVEFEGRILQPSEQCMSPTGWGKNVRKLRGGKNYGCAAVPGVNAKRDFAWGIYQVEQLKIGFISVHMPPGAYNAGTPVQRQHRLQSILQWQAFKRRIQRRIRKLLRHCDVVVVVGDINRPGMWTFSKMTRLSDPMLVYIGIRAKKKIKVNKHVTTQHKQNADHPAQKSVVTLTVPK